MYYLRSRYYNPETDRFANADTLLGETGVIFDHNGYAYCTNNPILKSDPSGLSSIGVVAGSAVATLFLGWLNSLATIYYMENASDNSYVHSEANDPVNELADSAKQVVESLNIDPNLTFEHSVYVLKDMEKNVRYVGRTNNVKRRRREHQRDKKNYNMVVVATGMNKFQAMLYEQFLISYVSKNLFR